MTLISVVVLGAGPTGLGAASMLQKSSQGSWCVYEKAPHVGGLSASFVDGNGFTWDVGGHVMFSHYDSFDSIVDEALDGQYLQHMRSCWVRALETWVPYPFQNNIRYLPVAAREACLDGLRNLPTVSGREQNFKEWMAAIFGEGIVRYFMAPYNFKVWATPPEKMSKDWIAERVSVVSLEKIERNIREEVDELSWGPNNLFKFPLHGGTGAIYQKIAAKFSDHIEVGVELTGARLSEKRLYFSDGSTVEFERLISTIPIDQLVSCCEDVPSDVRRAATSLLHNGVFVVGIGLRGRRDDSRCWMYFPEDNCPFYRVTNFHNYSPNNVPGGESGQFFSLMCETSYSAFKPVDKDSIVDDTIQGLINCGLLEEGDRANIVSRFLLDVPYAYPVPSIGRDGALTLIHGCLEEHEVYSRGRFGAWKYEVGNMDHSFMQGVEVVDRIFSRRPEQTFYG